MNTKMLSQPASGCSHKQKLLWLQKRRFTGLWVQCDKCNRWRYLSNILDKHELSKKWFCNMNPARSIASCSEPEVPIQLHEEEDLIHSEYAAGSLVAARLPGWPWWPAMVDDCPDTEQYYWLDGFSDIPTHYNVVFFDIHEVTRAWIAPTQLKNYAEAQNLLSKSLKNKTYEKRLTDAIKQADDAEILPLRERLAKYSFVTRYNGKILTPKKIKKNEAKKYLEVFKRKFKVDLPAELSDSDEDATIGSLATQKYNERNTLKKNKKLDFNNNENVINEHSDDNLITNLQENVGCIFKKMQDVSHNPDFTSCSLNEGTQVTNLNEQDRMNSEDFDFK